MTCWLMWRCQLQQHGPDCHPNGCRGYGDLNSDVMLIGIAPGQDEVESGRPFTGPSGRLLDGVLQYVGWSRDNIYATNLICWYNDAPDASEIARCSRRLMDEIAMVKPKLIIPL